MLSSILPAAVIPTIGWTEGLVILAVVLFIFGPQRLPEIAEAMGKSIRRFKSGAKELQDEITSDDNKQPPKQD